MPRAELHGDRVVFCYPQRAGDLAERIARIAEEQRDAIAVVEGDKRLSYADLFAQAGSLAAQLAKDGVAAGDRVAVMLNNSVDAVRAVVAILRLGAVLVAVSTRSRAPELDHVCRDSAPTAIIHGPEFSDVVAGALAAPAARFDVSAAMWRDAIVRRDVLPSALPADEDALFAIL